MLTKNHSYTKHALLLLLSTINEPAWCSAFQMLQQNVTNLGTAYAGTGSLAEDASTNYYSTAGLTKLGNKQIVAGGTFIHPQVTLNVSHATSSFGTTFSPNAGKTKPNNTALLPFLHYAKRIDDRWIFGFSATAPFGSKANYNDSSIARYTATKSEIKTLDLTPSLAYQFDHGISLGAGIDALYMMTRQNFRLGTGNVNTDGFMENTTSNWGLGYHIGGLYELDTCTRLGIQYHSKFDVKTKGESLTQLTASVPTTNQGLKSDFHLPDSTVLSVYHAFNEQWAAMADVQFTNWDRFKNVTLRFDNGSQLIINENYKNTYRVAAGGSYQYNEPWRFRFGIMFDKTPVPDVNRNISIPNQSQILPAIGAQYRICKTLAFDFGYAHAFYKKDKNLNQTAPIGIPQRRQSVQGSIKNRIDTIGLQLTWDIEPS